MKKNISMKQLLTEWRKGLVTELHDSYPRNEWINDDFGDGKTSFGQWGDLELSVKNKNFGYGNPKIWVVSVSTEASGGGGQTSSSIHEYLTVSGSVAQFRGSSWDLETSDLENKKCAFADYDAAFKAADAYKDEWLAENSAEESQANIDRKKSVDDFYSGGKDGYTRT